VPPDRFIRVAEATGLILGLGEFVLREACAQSAQWRREGLLPEGFVTWVNLSGRQLVGGGISRTVRAALEATGLPAECLGLEVTETSLVEEGPGGARARAELSCCTTTACASPSTTSAPVSRRSGSCAASRWT
jgi:EAL domain-containing protein (putative c-di-GMP-specific phosphodiesterase class I)